MKTKICGISDSETLKYLTRHTNSPEFIGFIVNYQKSKRFVEYHKLKKLLKVDKNNSKYVAVLVQPDENILKKIKDLPFDYYQIYDCNSAELKFIKDLQSNLGASSQEAIAKIESQQTIIEDLKSRIETLEG